VLLGGDIVTPALRFQVLTDVGQVLVDELVGLEGVEETAARHGEVAKGALDAGLAVTLVVRDPDDGGAVVHVEHREPDVGPALPTALMLATDLGQVPPPWFVPIEAPACALVLLVFGPANGAVTEARRCDLVAGHAGGEHRQVLDVATGECRCWTVAPWTGMGTGPGEASDA
jgi:hypothetical protein